MQSMTALNDVVLSTNPNNLRSHRRFVINDKRLWQLKIQGRKFPLDWVHDISRTGLQIRQGQYQGFQLGETINIQLRFLGSAILDVSGTVKWIREDNKHMNMNVMGIEFSSVKGMPLKKWVNKRMFRSQGLQAQEEVQNLQFIEAQNEKSRQRYRLKEWQIAAAVLLPFVAGYMLAFFN